MEYISEFLNSILSPDSEIMNLIYIAIGLYISSKVRSYIKHATEKEKQKELDKKQKDLKLLNSIPNAAESTSRLYTLCNRMLFETKGQRVLVNKISNGGQIAKVGNGLYVTAIAEASGKSLEPVLPLYQKQLMGSSFTASINKMFKDGIMVIRTKDLNVESKLHATYASSDVVFSYSVPICFTEKAFFYITLHFNHEFNINDPKFIQDMREYVNQATACISISHDNVSSFDNYKAGLK